MRKFIRLAACVLLAALLFSSCGGSESGGGIGIRSWGGVAIEGGTSDALEDEETPAYDLLNEEERALFDRLTGVISKAFYDDASEVRVEKIYKFSGVSIGKDDFLILVDLRGTGKLSGALSHEYIALTSIALASLDEGSAAIQYGDIPESSQPVPESEMDPEKINDALEEYWSDIEKINDALEEHWSDIER